MSDETCKGCKVARVVGVVLGATAAVMAVAVSLVPRRRRHG